MANRRFLAWGALSLLLSGCYSYAPVQGGNAPVGASVRARVSATEAERLREVLGREDRVLEGQMMGEENGGLLVQVPAQVTATGSSTNWLKQRVTIPRSEIVELEVRRLDRVRTAGVAAVAAAIAGFAIVEAFGGGKNPSGSGGKGGSDKAIGIVIPWRW